LNLLWRVSVSTSVEAEDAISALFGELFPEPASAYTDARTGRTVVAVYCPGRARPRPQIVGELRKGIERIRACSLDVAPGRVAIKAVPAEDWAETWKKHFKPLEIGAELLIKPGWSKRRPRKGQALVVLDPGLSFGTGQHPTTSFCLRQLVAWRDPQRRQVFLDLGTGSGILAIAAAKLGYEPVHAVDLDPVAVRVARTNAIRNGVQDRVRVSRRDIARLPRHRGVPYDVICANLSYDLLLGAQQTLPERLRPGGKLVLAGLLKTQFDRVQKAYSAAGLTLIRSRVEKGWQSAVFGRSG